MQKTYSIVPPKFRGPGAAEITPKVAGLITRKRHELEAIFNSPAVVEVWHDGKCVKVVDAAQVEHPEGTRFEDSSEYGHPVSYAIEGDGERPDFYAVSWKVKEEDSGTDPGDKTVVRVWFKVAEGDNLDDAYRRAEQKIRAAMPQGSQFSKTALQRLESVVTVAWMRTRGSFFWDNRYKDFATTLYFDRRHDFGDGMRGGYLMLTASDDFIGWLTAHVPSRAVATRKDSYMIKAINTAATNHTIANGTIPHAMVAKTDNAVYVSCGDSMMCRVTAGKVEMVDNGTDNVVFQSGKTLAPWRIVDGGGTDPFAQCRLFKNGNFENEHGCMIVRLWWFGIFADLLAKPAILFTGPRRSGKTRMAEGIADILKVGPFRCAAINEKGDDDFWVAIDKGGFVCFDNVDTKTSWFGDAAQLASTKGVREKRRLYKEESRLFRANAAIAYTSNNPVFGGDAGLADRLLIVRLIPFTSEQETADAELAADIEKHRDAILTWTVKTIAKALADTKPVPNINKRHPDYCGFALRCARAAGMFDAACAALAEAESDKAIFALQNCRATEHMMRVIDAEDVRPGTQTRFPPGHWKGTASEMVADIRRLCQVDPYDKMLNPRVIGKALGRMSGELHVCYQIAPQKTVHGNLSYEFEGFRKWYLDYLKKQNPDDERFSNPPKKN